MLGKIGLVTVLAIGFSMTAHASESTALRNGQNGTCAAPTSTVSGASVILGACAGAAAQLWHGEYLGFNHYRVRNAQTGLCLAVAGSSLADGALIVQQTCNTSSAQDWKKGPTLVGTGTELINWGSGKCVDAVIGGTTVRQETCAGTSAHNQLWISDI
jgi:ricin-type beta-trefoil lectin protein